MIILDTDVLTLVQSRSGTAYENLAKRLDASGEPVYTTIVTYEEQMRGWLARIARGRDIRGHVLAYSRLHDLLDDYRRRPVLPYDTACGRVFEGLRRSRLRIGTMDLRIAAIVVHHNATLISRNLGDFQRVPGLDVQDWTLEES